MERKIYEITFWARNGLGSKVEENLLELIKNFDFELIKKIPVKAKELAYPIQKETVGELGTIYFYGISNKMEEFQAKVRQIKEILRFIIVKRKALKPSELNSSSEVISSVVSENLSSSVKQ